MCEGIVAPAVGAIAEDRRFPAVCTSAHFLAALGLTAFWYGHGRV